MYEHPGIIPTLNGQPFVEKPPLYYWLTAASFRVAGGPHAAAARAVSGLAGMLTLAVVFLWVSRARSNDAAAVTTVLLATFMAFVTSVHWVRIDAVLMLFCSIAIWSAWERIGRGAGPGFLTLFYAGLVLALWTKGLVGPVLVGVGLVTYAALSRSVAVLRPLRPILGLAVLASAFAALAAAIAATGGYEALRTWLYVNHIERFVHPVSTGHEAPFYYYVWTLPAAIAPWVVPFAALFHVKGPLWRRGRADAALVLFALALAMGPLLVLSAASSKRQVYLLPLLPSLALLMASTILDRIDAGRDPLRSGAWARAGDWSQATILGVLGLAPAVAEIVIARRVTPISGALLVLGVSAATWLAAAVWVRELRRAFWIGTSCMAIALAGAVALAVPRVDAVKSLEPFFATIDPLLPKGEPMRAIGADETLLGIVPFVTGRRVISVEAGRLDDAPFVLVQSNGSEEDPVARDGSYDRVLERQFGPKRRMTLWRRRG
jgi:4-amino-4-deoxy-L-arabinose transferase-like glycosyltransferase